MTWLPPQYAKKQVLKLRLGTYVTPHALRVFDKILSGWQKLWSRWRRKKLVAKAQLASASFWKNFEIWALNKNVIYICSHLGV